MPSAPPPPPKKIIPGRKVNLHKMADGRHHVVAGVLKKYLRGNNIEMPSYHKTLKDNYTQRLSAKQQHAQRTQHAQHAQQHLNAQQHNVLIN